VPITKDGRDVSRLQRLNGSVDEWLTGSVDECVGATTRRVHAPPGVQAWRRICRHGPRGHFI
jgi:hypothetical protein